MLSSCLTHISISIHCDITEGSGTGRKEGQLKHCKHIRMFKNLEVKLRSTYMHLLEAVLTIFLETVSDKALPLEVWRTAV